MPATRSSKPTLAPPLQTPYRTRRPRQRQQPATTVSADTTVPDRVPDPTAESSRPGLSTSPPTSSTSRATATDTTAPPTSHPTLPGASVAASVAHIKPAESSPPTSQAPSVPDPFGGRPPPWDPAYVKSNPMTPDDWKSFFNGTYTRPTDEEYYSDSDSDSDHLKQPTKESLKAYQDWLGGRDEKEAWEEAMVGIDKAMDEFWDTLKQGRYPAFLP